MTYFLKFAFGALVPGETLRMIEEATLSEPVALQEGFDAYDECSSHSIRPEYAFQWISKS